MLFEEVKIENIKKPSFQYIGEMVNEKMTTAYDSIFACKGADRIND